MVHDTIAGMQTRIARLSDALGRFAIECDLAGPPSRYVFAGRSLLNQRALEREPQLWRHVVRFDRDVPSIALPLAAREIFIGTDARALGLELAPHLAAKIIWQRPVLPSLYRDRIARRAISDRLAGSSYVFVPRVHSYGVGDQWLIEEFVESKPATPADLESFLTGGAAADFYGATARVDAIGRRRSTVRLLEELAKLDPGYPPLTKDARLLVSITHGDPQFHNLLRTPSGRLCVVDMDKARVGPVAGDLAKICRRRPDLLGAVLALLDRLDPSRRALPARLQLALGMVSEWLDYVLEDKPKAERHITRATRLTRDFLKRVRRQT